MSRNQQSSRKTLELPEIRIKTELNIKWNKFNDNNSVLNLKNYDRKINIQN